jgi:hypothetical protein
MQGGRYGGGKRYAIKPRFFLILAVLVGALVWAAVAMAGALGSPKIEWGRLASDQAISAIVLRDEQVVPAEESGQLSCVAAEGGEVAQSETIAMLYLSGYSDKDNANLLKLQDEIKDYQKNRVIKDAIDQGLLAINSKIDDKMKEISAKVIAGQTQDLAAAEQELRIFMDERRQYMKDTIQNPDETLNRMYGQEATLQAKIEQTRKSVASPADGLVSFYLDGYEKTLTLNGIADMTPAKVKALKDAILRGSQPFQSVKIVYAQNPVCRVVNPAKWYAVVVMNERECPFIEGMDTDVTFDGLQKTATAKVLKVVREGGQALAVLEVDEGVREMMSIRLVNGHIGQDISGFRVPADMVLEENGKAYIKIQGTGANVTSIEVHVLGRDERYAIIEQASGSGNLAIGMPLVKP